MFRVSGHSSLSNALSTLQEAGNVSLKAKETLEQVSPTKVEKTVDLNLQVQKTVDVPPGLQAPIQPPSPALPPMYTLTGVGELTPEEPVYIPAPEPEPSSLIPRVLPAIVGLF